MQLHPGLHLHTPKAELKQLFDDTAASFKEPATRLEFYLRVAPVVEKVKCGHTYFDLPRRTLKKLSTDAQSFPLPLIFLDRKALVDLPGGAVALGAGLEGETALVLGGIAVHRELSRKRALSYCAGLFRRGRHRPLGTERAESRSGPVSA